jgi:formiminotetrahydrofolate cyclodeaminase
MTMLDDTCKNFISKLASRDAVPGGGGAAAFGGAIGMALSNMVGNLTVGKKKYAVVDKDAEVFTPLSQAYGLPKNTAEELAYKEATVEQYSKQACAVPMDIMRKANEGITIQHRMGQIGTMIAVSDIGCGVTFLKSALIAGSLNVIINLNAINDKAFIKRTREEMDRLLNDGSKLADETLKIVISKLTK